MSLTVPQIIVIAKISQYLSLVDIKKSGLYGGGTELDLPHKLRIVREDIEYQYDLDPTNSTLDATSQYLYALCGKYALYAQHVTGGGGTIAPTAGSQGFPIYITSSSFTTATFYPNTRLNGNSLLVFVNEYNRYLLPTEFTVSVTGLTITEANFDATVNTYNLVIEKVYS